MFDVSIDFRTLVSIILVSLKAIKSLFNYKNGTQLTVYNFRLVYQKHSHIILLKGDEPRIGSRVPIRGTFANWFIVILFEFFKT
jgi:hypothetical protein